MTKEEAIEARRCLVRVEGEWYVASHGTRLGFGTWYVRSPVTRAFDVIFDQEITAYAPLPKELDSRRANDGATIETCRHCGLEWRCPDCDGGLCEPASLPEEV